MNSVKCIQFNPHSQGLSCSCRAVFEEPTVLMVGKFSGLSIQPQVVIRADMSSHHNKRTSHGVNP